MYEWSYGEAPLSVEPDPVHIEIDDEDQGAGDQVILSMYFRPYQLTTLLIKNLKFIGRQRTASLS